MARQVVAGNPKTIASAVFSITDIAEEITTLTIRRVNKEITDLCATSNPSILRKTSKEELSNISWEQVHKELTERTPTFLRLIEASVQNPSQARNTNKRSDNLIPPMCDAACQLISIFSEGMCATRRIKSIILKKGGLKKIGFQRLARIYACMGYKSTNKMFETFAEGFDIKLLEWKEKVEQGVEKEKEILANLSKADSSAEEVICSYTDDLRKHRASMHPSFSFAGDNVDVFLKPRQMMKCNQNNDVHMFQNVAYENRISSNHLSDEQPVVDMDKISWLSAQVQTRLAEDLVVLVCQRWAKYIPALSWLVDYVPEHIPHKHMDEVQRKTNKVNYIIN